MMVEIYDGGYGGASITLRTCSSVIPIASSDAMSSTSLHFASVLTSATKSSTLLMISFLARYNMLWLLVGVAPPLR